MENKRERERIKSERQRQEDLAFIKIVSWFVGAVVLMVLVWMADRYYVQLYTDMLDLAFGIDAALKVLLFAGPVAAILCGVLAFRIERGRMVLWAVAVFAVALTVSGTAVRYFGASGVALMYILIPAATVLALIYYLYQREFFAVAAVSGAGLLGLWMVLRGGGADVRIWVVLVLLGLFLVAVAVAARYLQTKDGVLTIQGKQYTLLPEKANYLLIYITCAVAALVVLAALILGGAGSTMAYYAVPVAWLLVMAVYYTVKLM